MNKLLMAMLVCMTLVSTGYSASKPPVPAPEPNFTDPGTPDQRRAYKIAVLENEIAQDQYIINSADGGKGSVSATRKEIAQKNLKMNQEVLAKVKAGADMEVYFCSICGRQMMKDCNCGHCKLMKSQKTVPLFDHKGHLRPSTVLENS